MIYKSLHYILVCSYTYIVFNLYLFECTCVYFYECRIDCMYRSYSDNH